MTNQRRQFAEEENWWSFTETTEVPEKGEKAKKPVNHHEIGIAGSIGKKIKSGNSASSCEKYKSVKPQ
jgi:hypothetical protein